MSDNFATQPGSDEAAERLLVCDKCAAIWSWDRDDNDPFTSYEYEIGTEHAGCGGRKRELGDDRLNAKSYLVRLGAPSRGETIHRHTCTIIQRAKGPALRWKWADENPEIDWRIAAPWLKACKVCKPPSPACESCS